MLLYECLIYVILIIDTAGKKKRKYFLFRRIQVYELARNKPIGFFAVILSRVFIHSNFITGYEI